MDYLISKPFFVPVWATLLLSLLLSSCDVTRGRGDLITETRPEKNFHALEVHTGGRIEVRTDSVFKVEVTCEENILPYLETDVKNGVLKINFDRTVYDVDGLRIVVSAPQWDGFELSGSADLEVEDPIKGKDLALRVSGSGDIDVSKAEFEKVQCSVAGSGSVTLSGKGDVLEANISGSGDIEALQFPVKKSKVNISGSGDARMEVTETLEVIINGSGSLEYRGNAVVNSHINGSGRVRKI